MIFEYQPADPVILPFMSSPWPLIMMLSTYLYFVFILGRELMEHRKPYNVQKAMVIYNAIQIVFNSTVFVAAFYYLFINPMYDLRCLETLPLDHPYKNTERIVIYMYFLNKILDLMDTVFFVLRKSFKQVTALHVYHHCLMIIAPHFAYVYYGPGGQFNVIGLLNSFVHICMYSYYFITALFPAHKGNLWWKKYITLIQLSQFIILVLQVLWVLIFNPSCQFPLILHAIQFSQSAIMIYLFGNFYIKTYIMKKSIE